MFTDNVLWFYFQVERLQERFSLVTTVASGVGMLVGLATRPFRNKNKQIKDISHVEDTKTVTDTKDWNTLNL